jgi:integrase
MNGIDNTSDKAASKLRQRLKYSIRRRTYYGSDDEKKNKKHLVKLKRNQQLQKLKEKNPKAKISDLPPDPFIYSRRTSECYQDIIDRVCRIAEATLPANEWRTVRDARAFFVKYLEDRINKGTYSPWTVCQEASALAKALNIRRAEFGLILPKRKREYIKKNRTLIPKNGFSEKLNEDCVLIAKAIGTRTNCELLRMRPSDFGLIPNNDIDENGNVLIGTKIWAGYYGCKVRGKGGKTRWVLARPDLAERLKEILKKYEQNKRIFTITNNPVKSRFPGHIYRREYVRTMYGIYQPAAATKLSDLVEKSEKLDTKNQIYYCRGSRVGQAYYKEALQACSWLLGHNRLDVVVNNYLDDEISVEEAQRNSERIKEILKNGF